ncbi:hypothetical protein SFC65_20210 [Priestia filamentosa]|uniref:hypothetical protein n=1 Tax=Priestia filamentosa TaxID=1402861 RepID=UPI0039820DC7
MNKVQVIKEILAKCQNYGGTYIVGGYVRNHLLNQDDFNDVGLLTTLPISILKELFPALNWTEQGLSLNISRLNFNGV